MRPRRPRGMAAFVVIWLGQVLSAAGTRMINFAFAIWVWQRTGHASDLALLTLLAFAATVLVSPIAGPLVDRWNRRTSIIMSDVGSAAATVVALVLFATGTASFWPLVAVNTVSGAFLAFQYPAYSTLISTLLSKDQYSRANGMLSLVRSAPAIFAPGVAGILMAFSGIWVVLVTALAAYVVAVATVYTVALPGRPAAGSGAAAPVSFWRDSMFGFRYILSRPGFPQTQAILFVVSLVSAMGFIVLTPLVLIKSGNSEAQLGAVNSIGAVGGVLGALTVSALRPTDRKMRRVLWAALGFCLSGRVLMGWGDGFVVWSVAWFVSWLIVPFVEAYSLAIWQQKVAPEVQGRVFAAMQFVSQLAFLLGFAVTGVLVDRLFEPQMRPGGSLAAVFGHLVGTAPGAGMKLIFLLSGLLGVVMVLYGFGTRRVREIERIVPDHAPAPPADAGTGGRDVAPVLAVDTPSTVDGSVPPPEPVSTVDVTASRSPENRRSHE